ncbi:MAG: glycosyltransferase [Alphaproteobacteria bacterium]|nr:glycosyltransferase [Alphaproteobacteria bacterium]
MKKNKIAVVIPCYNEGLAIGGVVEEFRQVLPDAEVYVYDNNSQDDTFVRAKEAGAIVRKEPLQGKGNVVRRMFADIDADIYIMSDGDKTYDIAKAPLLIKTLVENNLDMVTGVRKEVDLAAYRVGHRWGNIMLTKLVQWFFKHHLTDMLSGFRAFSRRFVKTFPAASKGFEIETELTVHALSSRLPTAEVETDYFARPIGSESKLSTIKDGIRILMMIVNLVKDERPMLFFSAISAMFFAASLFLGMPVIIHYFQTGTVPWLPRSILAMGLMICFGLCLLVGFILDSQRKTRHENRRMHYLNHK